VESLCTGTQMCLHSQKIIKFSLSIGQLFLKIRWVRMILRGLSSEVFILIKGFARKKRDLNLEWFRQWKYTKCGRALFGLMTMKLTRTGLKLKELLHSYGTSMVSEIAVNRKLIFRKFKHHCGKLRGRTPTFGQTIGSKLMIIILFDE